MNEFVKSHGLGNDYIVLDSNNISFTLNEDTIKLICNRNYGIGSDGILLLVNSQTSDFGLKILNPDGSEAEKSGNGLRIFSKYLFEHKHTSKDSITIETMGGVVRAELEIKDNKVPFVTVEMGNADFKSKDIPVTGDDREVVNENLRINGEMLNYTAVSVGNPHCVVLMDELDKAYIKKLGPLIENHKNFPNRINVQLAKVISKQRVEILIWERGAGYTLASGSSSCAVAAACVKNGLTERDVIVSMPGGELTIQIREDWSIKMRGAAEEIASGVLSPDFIQKINSF